jgi:hypothetical protein
MTQDEIIETIDKMVNSTLSQLATADEHNIMLRLQGALMFGRQIREKVSQGGAPQQDSDSPI